MPKNAVEMPYGISRHFVFGCDFLCKLLTVSVLNAKYLRHFLRCNSLTIRELSTAFQFKNCKIEVAFFLTSSTIICGSRGMALPP